MTNPNRIGIAIPGYDGPVNFIDFTNSMGLGTGNTAGPIAPMEWVIPATGPFVNAFSKRDWETYMQSSPTAGVGSAQANFGSPNGLASYTSIDNKGGAVMILNASVLTS